MTTKEFIAMVAAGIKSELKSYWSVRYDAKSQEDYVIEPFQPLEYFVDLFYASLGEPIEEICDPGEEELLVQEKLEDWLEQNEAEIRKVYREVWKQRYKFLENVYRKVTEQRYTLDTDSPIPKPGVSVGFKR